MSSEKYGRHSSCSLILSLQAPVPLIRFTAALMGPVFTITVAGSLLRDASKMYNKFSRVFTEDFISGMCKQERCDAVRFFFGISFFEVPLMANPLIRSFCLDFQTTDTVEAGGCIALLSH